MNKNNQTTSGCIFNTELVKVGNYTYGGLNVISYSNQNKLIIGDFCSIAPEVVFLLNAEHNTNCFSTYPFKVRCLSEENESFGKGNIVVEDDVWIGYGAIILSGVRLGRGSIIAAGSIVTKDVSPYTIVGGNPARIIKKRFNDNIISKLVAFDFKLLNGENIEKNINLLYENLTEENVDILLDNLKSN